MEPFCEINVKSVIFSALSKVLVEFMLELGDSFHHGWFDIHEKKCGEL